MLEIFLLGTFHVTYESQPVTGFRSQSERALLALLSVQRDRPQWRDALVGLLWPERTEEQARNNLRVALHRLRKVLQHATGQTEVLLADGDAIQLHPKLSIWLDVTAFRSHLSQARTIAEAKGTADPQRLRQLTRAAALYRDEFLKGFSFDQSEAFAQWLVTVRERLHGEALTALYELTEHHQRRGELKRALVYARRQLELEPWRERAHRQLIGILGRSGERGAALAQFYTCQRVLNEELGIDPDEETVRLYERIRVIRQPAVSNMPRQPSRFIGREQELDTIAAQLSDPTCRLLTMTGTGGVGKTRLAVEVAQQTARAYLHGACFVPLAPVASPARLAPAVARALNIPAPRQTNPVELLTHYLRDREILLILDNFEHLREGSSLLLGLLDATADVKLLVTSRERLDLRAERVIEIGGLDYPTTETVFLPGTYGAGRLFVDRVRQQQPAYEPTADDAMAIITICQHVEALPLALELAANWVQVLSPQEIAVDIQAESALLATSARDVPPRHRSMEAVIDQSWRLLSSSEQGLLSRLSVFVGSFDRLAAKHVTGASLSLLRSLVNKSLLQRYHPHGANVPSQARFTLHELVRRFASQRLSENVEEQTATKRSYITYYTAFLSMRRQLIRGPDEPRVLQEVREDYDNLRRAVLLACKEPDIGQLAQALDVLGQFYAMGYYSYLEAEEVFGEIVKVLSTATVPRSDAPERTEAALVHALGHLGWFCMHLDKPVEAAALTKRALELAYRCGDLEGQYGTMNTLANLAVGRGDYSQAATRYRQALKAATAAGDPWWQAGIRSNLGNLFLQAGRLRAARRCFEQALVEQQEISDPYACSGTLYRLAQVNLMDGALPVAREQMVESLALARESNYVLVEALALAGLGQLMLEEGEGEMAEGHLTQALMFFREMGLPKDVEAVEGLLRKLPLPRGN